MNLDDNEGEEHKVMLMGIDNNQTLFIRRALSLVLCIFILSCWYSCEEPDNDDNTPPTISITYPKTGYRLHEIVTITCVPEDDEGIERVELWVDGDSTGIIDKTDPFDLVWNTTAYSDGDHSIMIRVYDINGNITDSNVLFILVDNEYYYPTSSEIHPIRFHAGAFNISWKENTDNDFTSYKLFESINDDMSDSICIYESNISTITAFEVTGINEGIRRYYQIIVTDQFGFETNCRIVDGNSIYQIVFTSYKNNQYDIYLMDIDGTNLKQLTNTSEYEGEPCFSPDGNQIWFLAEPENSPEERETCTMDVSGANRIIFSDQHPFIKPIFTPDGSELVFTGYSSDNAEIFIMDMDGNNIRQLTESDGHSSHPVLSPDGTKIVFMSNRVYNTELYTMDINGDNQTRLTEFYIEELYPQFSPDGEKIVFSTVRNSEWGIYIINFDGTNLIKLYDISMRSGHPRFTPDGSQIIFDYWDETLYPRIAIMDVSGDNFSILTDYTNVLQTGVSFTNDGSHFIFESYQSGNREIYMMDIDGSNEVNLTNYSSYDGFADIEPSP